MKVKIIKVGKDVTGFDVPKGFEPFHIHGQYAEWVVFLRPTGS